MRTRFSILAVFVMVLTVVPMGPVMANGEESGTVSGTVFLGDGIDGGGLAGVEVFLADGLGGRYTCTNQDGDYVFTDVGGFGFIATGPSVELDCSNPKFVDDDGNPLVVAAHEEDENGPAEVDFHVERLPQDHPGFFHQLRTALYNCYDHTGGATADILDGFQTRLDEALTEGQPKLSQDVADTYGSYASDLGSIANRVCPQT